ncbi:hypothetical protein CPT03_02195 [Pedobacter ginsengisoli]|uniref:Uncharacterized protein n=2 Tax=Pedobacter ginsengisoli TaxID=363852 RepID=A0A2D1U182_9SPHI|nr:hypothetical protein CPT03_02195 [Pedobacter ginsengisoli]
MKGDLEQIFTQDKIALTTAYNKKTSAITKKYNALLNKLEDGEGKGEEEEEMERMKKARCEEYNKESQQYLSDLAKLTNQFAQKSELVSRIFFRDYANWMPVQLNDNSNRFLLDAQAKYITDVKKIRSHPGQSNGKKIIVPTLKERWGWALQRSGSTVTP